MVLLFGVDVVDFGDLSCFVGLWYFWCLVVYLCFSILFCV